MFGGSFLFNIGEEVAMILFGIGFANLLFQKNLIKKIIGFNIMDTAIYLFLAEKFGCDPNECLMVGNDVSDDMPARDAGWKVFLVTDCLINRKNVDLSVYPNGDWKDLLLYVEKNDIL